MVVADARQFVTAVMWHDSKAARHDVTVRLAAPSVRSALAADAHPAMPLPNDMTSGCSTLRSSASLPAIRRGLRESQEMY